MAIDPYERMARWLVEAALLIVGLEYYRFGEIKGWPGTRIRGATKSIGVALVVGAIALAFQLPRL